MLAEIVCSDTAHVVEVSDNIRDVDGVVDVEVMTYLRMVQQTYDWGTN